MMKNTLLFLLNDVADLPDFKEYRSDWDVIAAPNTEHALQALGDGNYEAVIADDKFQSNNEVPFFSRVVNRAPNTTRILLTATTEGKETPSDAEVHQYLDRTCTAQDIIAGVERARLVDRWMKKPAIQNLYGQMKILPSVPSIYFRLVKAMQSPDTELSFIGQIIGEDLVMTAKVLQVVNSALFGLGRHISNPVEAVSYLGIERTKALALVAHSFSNLKIPAECNFSIEKLWEHSMGTASLAQMMTREETGDSKMADSAFTGGLLHDVGKLMLAVNLPDDYKAVLNMSQSMQIPFHEAENKVLGANHTQIGACVMGSWGLPPEIVEAIAFHHNPSEYFVEGFTPATGIHVANVLERELRGDKDPMPHTLDDAHLEAVGMTDRLPMWREIVGSPEPESAA